MVYWVSLLICLGALIPACHSDPEWRSLTYDNDIFVGEDSGYTNGIYFSQYKTNQKSDKLTPGVLLNPLLWSLPEETHLEQFSSTTIGQAILTPFDITQETPDEGQLPYSGLLFMNQTFIVQNGSIADKVSTTLGVVGPWSGAESTQKFVHKMIGSDQPEGWDQQLDNELVFQFSRGRAWRNWHSKSNNMDFVSMAEVQLGTIESSINAGFLLRYGQEIEETYAAGLLSPSRTTNPVAIEGGWYVYAGLHFAHLFNNIHADGNTFSNSASINYQRLQSGGFLGLAYSWQDFSITFAVNNIKVGIFSVDENIEDVLQYGSLTFLWRV